MSSAGHPPVTPSNPGPPGVLRRPGAELRRQLGVCRIVLTSPGLRAAQVPLAVSKTVDLAQLIGLSTYLFDIEGVVQWPSTESSARSHRQSAFPW